MLRIMNSHDGSKGHQKDWTPTKNPGRLRSGLHHDPEGAQGEAQETRQQRLDRRADSQGITNGGEINHRHFSFLKQRVCVSLQDLTPLLEKVRPLVGAAHLTAGLMV